MTVIKKYNSYVLIFVIFLNIGCVREISTNLSDDSTKNVSLTAQKNYGTHNNGQGYDLIWNVRYTNQRKIFFRNTCTNRSCVVIWKSKNILGIWSQYNEDLIPPQSELSYPVSLFDVHFDVDYHFQ